MGTRSNTVFVDGSTQILNVYRQHDGYIDGHGVELAEFLSSLTLVNGLGGDTSKIANGINCLVAQFVSEFKTGAGGIYIHPPINSPENDYTYIIVGSIDDPLVIHVFEFETQIFSGNVDEFLDFCHSPDSMDYNNLDNQIEFKKLICRG